MNTENNALQTYTIRRKMNTPIRFRGILLSEVKVENPNNGYLYEVAIYKTQGGKYVAETYAYFSFGREKVFDGNSFSKPEAMIEWFRNEDGEISEANLAALRKAAAKDSSVEAAFVTMVD